MDRGVENFDKCRWTLSVRLALNQIEKPCTLFTRKMYNNQFFVHIFDFLSVFV